MASAVRVRKVLTRVQETTACTHLLVHVRSCVCLCVPRTRAIRLVPVLAHELHDQVAVEFVRVTVLVPATPMLVGPLHSQDGLRPVGTVSRVSTAHKELLIVYALLI